MSNMAAHPVDEKWARMNRRQRNALMESQNRFYWIKRGILAVILLIPLLMAGCPMYSVWERGLSGKSELSKAEWNRQIAVQEAEAALQAATLLSKAEVERAKGVAAANEIVAKGLGGPEGYLRYLWIQSLSDGKSDVIYVPTEAQLPILEASRPVQQ